MIPQKIFDEVSQKISTLIAQSPARDIEKNIKSLLGASFNKLDLVSREEFDIQAEVLIRTRETLQQMEARIASLEEQLKAVQKPL